MLCALMLRNWRDRLVPLLGLVRRPWSDQRSKKDFEDHMKWQMLFAPLGGSALIVRESGFLGFNYRLLDQRKALLWMCVNGLARGVAFLLASGFLWLSPMWVAIPAVGVMAPSKMRWTKTIGWAFGQTALLYFVLGMLVKNSSILATAMQENLWSYVLAQSEGKSVAIGFILSFAVSLVVRTELLMSLIAVAMHSAGLISLPVVLGFCAADISAESISFWLRSKELDLLSRRMLGRFVGAEVASAVLALVFSVILVWNLDWQGLSGLERILTMLLAILILMGLQTLVLSLWGHFESQNPLDPDLERALARYQVPSRLCRQDPEAWEWLKSQLRRRLSEMNYVASGMGKQGDKIPESIRSRLAQEIQDLEKILGESGR